MRLFHAGIAAAFLAASCGGTIKYGDDAGDDTGVDVAVDTSADQPGDTLPDTATDTAMDVPEDTAVDTTPDPTTDEPAPECDQDLGTWTPGETWAGIGWSGGYWVETGAIGGSYLPPPISEVVIESFPEFGGPGSPGTYTMDAWEPGDSCILCIWLYEECADWWTGCAHFYMADRATLVIDAIDRRVGGRITGSLSGVHFVEVNSEGTRILEGGLSYCLDLWEFSNIFESMGG